VVVNPLQKVPALNQANIDLANVDVIRIKMDAAIGVARPLTDSFS